jgi:hypothetical protein
MLDETWLGELRFTAVNNIEVNGLAGIGSEFVALSGTRSNGDQCVIRTPKTSIAFHIQEVPPHLSLRPAYQLDRVNEKLQALVGNPMLDKMSTDYNELYCRILQIISKAGVPGLIFSNTLRESIETIPFILHTPALQRRLEEFSDWPIDPDDPLTRMPSVNGEKYPIQLIILPDRRDPWITETIEGLSRLPEYNKDLDAKSVFHNPLVVWGAAALDGFFTNEEMPKVATYLKCVYGSFVERSDVLTVLGQANAMASLVAQYLEAGHVGRFVELCAHCGLGFQVRNIKGEIVADGIKVALT